MKTRFNAHLSKMAWALMVGLLVALASLFSVGGPSTTMGQSEVTSSDASLRSLNLSDIYFGAFASSTESYTAGVVYSVSQTTVTPTVNHSGASYVIKLGGVTDADGTVSLAVGSNVITVEVTAEDGNTTKTYTGYTQPRLKRRLPHRSVSQRHIA